MTARRALLSASETQFALRRALGPIRAWSDFLADLAREQSKKVHVRGCRLFPIARRRDRCGRPLYDPAHVAEFIRNVWTADPSLRRDWSAVQREEFEFEEAPLLPWRMRRAEPVA